MSVENDFLPWATGGGANVMSQTDYAADSAVTNGVTSGTAVSALYNKATRQGNFFAVVLATMIVDQISAAVIDDGDVAGKVTLLQNAILALTSIYAPLASPHFTGNPTAVTQTSTDNSTRLSTTAFAQALVAALSATLTAAIALKANVNSPTFTGTPGGPTPATNDDSGNFATTEYVQNNLALYATALALAAAIAPLAPMNSPLFTGNPRTVTPSLTDDDNSIASTAFVKGQNLGGFSNTTSAQLRAIITDETGTGALVFANSPALAGDPTAPTQAVNDNSTNLSTTAYADRSSSRAVAAIPDAAIGTFGLSDYATHTQAENFTSDGVAVTPGGMGAAVSSLQWTSHNVAIPSSPGGSVAMGTPGFEIQNVTGYLICTAPGGSNGYSENDTYSLEGYTDANHALGAVFGWNVTGGSVFVVFGNASLFIKNKGTGNFEALNPSNWSVVAQAFGQP